LLSAVGASSTKLRQAPGLVQAAAGSRGSLRGIDEGWLAWRASSRSVHTASGHDTDWSSWRGDARQLHTAQAGVMPMQEARPPLGIEHAYQPVRMLGRGGYGEVWLRRCVSSSHKAKRQGLGSVEGRVAVCAADKCSFIF
jgi:hypothetical protein